MKQYKRIKLKSHTNKKSILWYFSCNGCKRLLTLGFGDYDFDFENKCCFDYPKKCNIKKASLYYYIE